MINPGGFLIETDKNYLEYLNQFSKKKNEKQIRKQLNQLLQHKIYLASSSAYQFKYIRAPP